MASNSFVCGIAETLLSQLCRQSVQASSPLECTLIKSLILLNEKNKTYQTADSTPAGATAKVTTTLPKMLTKIFNPAMKITFSKIFSKYIQCSTDDQSGLLNP